MGLSTNFIKDSSPIQALLSEISSLVDLQQYLQDLYEEEPIDIVGSLAYIKIIAKIREIFADPELLHLVDIYQITLRDNKD